MNNSPQKQAISRRAGRGRNYPPVAHQFKPGISGNPKGAKPGRTLTSRIRAILDVDDNAERLVQAGIKAPINGDFRFWQAIVERMDGRVLGKVAGDDGPVEIVVRHITKTPNPDNDHLLD
jgi:hypothetical protein